MASLWPGYTNGDVYVVKGGPERKEAFLARSTSCSFPAIELFNRAAAVYLNCLAENVKKPEYIATLNKWEVSRYLVIGTGSML